LSISERDLASLALGGLCSHFKEKLEGYDDPYISQLHIRALIQENKFKKAKKNVVKLISPVHMLIVNPAH
jgi:hypothetical protein